jgi:flagellar protein FliO/FliZ
MTKSTLLKRAAATAAAALGPCLALLACAPGAQAAGAHKGAGEETPLNLSAPSSSHVSTGGASLVRTIVGLVIVIAVIWGLSWILRQVKAGREPHAPSAGLQSVAALTLGSGRAVHLVRAGTEYVLLASAEHGLVPIHRYSEEEAREAGLLVAEQPPPRRRRALLALPPGDSEEPEATQARTNPMHVPSPGPGTTVLERLREWTVRR